MLAKLWSSEFAKEAESFRLTANDILKHDLALSKSKHSVPQAHPLFNTTIRSEVEKIVDQMYAKANNEPFNLDTAQLEQSRITFEALHNWNKDLTPGKGWDLVGNGLSITGPAPPTPYDAFQPLPHPLATTNAAPIMSQSPMALSPNV